MKPKKQHEMCRLARLTKRFNAFCKLNLNRLIDSVERNQGIERVLDIGAGVGHLSRYLSYNYRLQVLRISQL